MADIEQDFVRVAHGCVWCVLSTVDRSGRPRSRVVHPVWEAGPTGLVGWVTTRSAAPKVGHLARVPFAACAYRNEEHDVAVAECRAEVVHDEVERARVWQLCADAPAPVGFDPGSIWPSSADPGFGLLRLEPWRLSVGVDLAAGARPQVWIR